MPDRPSTSRRTKVRYVDHTRLPTGSKTILVVTAVLIGFGILSILKVFRSTPRGFRPNVRMSALDKLQAYSLAKAARQAAADGHIDDAILGWQSAIANDPGDPDLQRGLIGTLVHAPDAPQRFYALGASHAFYLLRLTHTNEADLNLTAQLLSRYGLDSFLVGFLEPNESNLTSEQAGAYLSSLFHLNSMDTFGRVWPRYSNSLASNREMALYQSAWQAGWGPTSTLRSGAESLAAAVRNPETATLARRLTLSVAAARSDISAFEQALAELTESHSDRIRDHLTHWRLLVKIGRRERAIELARSFDTPPETATDAGSVADALLGLGLTDPATTFLERQLGVFNYSPEIWQRLGEQYVQQERWNDLRALAVQVRASERVPLNQTGLTWYWEGLSETKVGRQDSAKTAMARVIEFPPMEPLIAFRIANGMQQAGFPDQATQLLRQLEKDFGDKAPYWLQLVIAAHQARQFDIMQTAAERGYALATNNPVFINNYAACLLIQRTNAPLAVELTLRRVTSAPNDLGANLNHALALLQNGRLEDAERLLNRLSTAELTPDNRTVLEFGYFELHFRRGNRAAALKSYRNIDPSHLMPPQIRWLEESYLALTR
jgi:tetratricopeptide (TPR) repeat protein